MSLAQFVDINQRSELGVMGHHYSTITWWPCSYGHSTQHFMHLVIFSWWVEYMCNGWGRPYMIVSYAIGRVFVMKADFSSVYWDALMKGNMTNAKETAKVGFIGD